MAYHDTLAQTVASLPERRRKIESAPLPENLHALLAEAASDNGSATLWNFFEIGETITYADCLERVERLAAGLQDLGVKKGDHVAVMMPNVPAMPLTWFAIATLGAVMVPVNTSYTPRELTYVLSNSDATFLVTHDSLAPLIEEFVRNASTKLQHDHVVVTGQDHGFTSWETLADTPRRPLDTSSVGHGDLLNIQYTSGTTGFPKGCMLTQEYWLVSGKANAFRDGRRYRNLLAPTPFYYMDPQWLLLMTIYQRGTLFVANKQSASRFMQWVRDYEINFCLMPYLIYKQEPQPEDGKNRLVRANIYGAPRDLHARIEQRFDVVAREAFGMTEVGPAMFMPIEATDMVGSGACGVPSPFRECKVIDESGNEAAPGEVGELCIRGRGILLGYYNNPSATESAFLDGWFRTGDAFRRDERGYFYIQGRYKDMIRRSAENIAAREVEAVLNGLNEVGESAAVPVPDSIRGEEVKAYIVLREGVPASDESLQRIIAGCQTNLAKFKVPRYYSFIDALPKTASLKIAKGTLREQATDMKERTFDRQSGQWLDAPNMEKSA
ncbi:Long-chain-fatty-acid--CoA ligase [Achromobacter veterisilvae]|uniref:Long-chain-fatty-acid--CoA ligase n=1 Tax=Achromobacter veterisilvae TaxID=2069367 RepID=A0A446CA20_9BURK|nr:AMP-binding protein [Achromobacter veterisilvae]SSW64757.1 Long-chain-fatty-acid--CoA ligase [Achromobacter veterisilvae]